MTHASDLVQDRNNHLIEDWNAAQRRYWASVAPSYDTLYSSDWSQREDKWVRSRLSFLSSLRQPTVLDLGCGTGLGAKFVRHWNPNATYIGVDISPEMVAATSRKYGVRCVVGTMDGLSWLQPGSVDVALSLFSSASFSPCLLRLLTAVNRVLRPGGFGYISTLSCRRGYRLGVYKTRGHATSFGTPSRYYNAAQLRRLATRVGLVDVRVDGMNAFADLVERPRLWALGRLLAATRSDCSHLLELTFTKAGY